MMAVVVLMLVAAAIMPSPSSCSWLAKYTPRTPPAAALPPSLLVVNSLASLSRHLYTNAILRPSFSPRAGSIGEAGALSWGRAVVPGFSLDRRLHLQQALNARGIISCYCCCRC